MGYKCKETGNEGLIANFRIGGSCISDQAEAVSGSLRQRMLKPVPMSETYWNCRSAVLEFCLRDSRAGQDSA